MAEDFEKESGTVRSGSWELVKTVAYAIVLATVFRSFALEPFHIPSGSMKPNLLVGDYIFVSKYTYGYSRYSFPFGSFIPVDGRSGDHRPERGDVVVFRLPGSTSTDYIKRVIGLPGDTIKVLKGRVYINGKSIPRARVDDFIETEGKNERRPILQFEETLPEGRAIHVLDDMPCNPSEDADEHTYINCSKADNPPTVYTVPEKHYFMMGDNRDHSQDSRYLDHVGYVPEENIVGRAEIVAFSSMNSGSQLWEIWKWAQDFRGDRFMKVIE